MVSAENIDDLFARGTERMKRRDFDAAIDHFTRCTKIVPEHPDPWLYAAKVHIARGDLENAAPYLERSWANTGDQCDALYLLFLTEAVLGRYRRAAEVLEEITYQQFLACYEPLCSVIGSLNRRTVRRYFSPVRFLWSPVGQRMLRTALHLMVLFPNRLTYRLAADALWAQRRQGLPDEALEVIIRDRILYLGAGSSGNRERLVSLLLSEMRPEEAAAVSGEGEADFPDDSAFPLLSGHAAFMTGRRQDATRHYGQAIGKTDDDWLPRVHFASGLVWDGEKEKGHQVFVETAHRSPDNPVAAFLAQVPENVLADLPDSRCVSCHGLRGIPTIIEEQLPAFSPKERPWGPSPFRANLPGMRQWRQGRKKHAPILSERRPSPCPACESNEIRPFATNRATGMTLGQCSNCAHVFAQPMPTPGSLASLYDKGYFQSWDRYVDYVLERKAAGESIASWPIYEEWLNWLASIDWDDWQESRGKGRSALDIGCASGAALIALRNRGWQVMGQEIGGRYQEYYRQLDIPFWSQPVVEIDLEAASLDLCTMTHVIEHLADAAETVAGIARWLKPGGRLLIMTPCCGTATAWLGGKYWYYMTEHVQFFTPRSLQILGDRFGLEPLYWRTRVGIRFETPFRSWRAYRIGGSFQALLEKSGQGDVIEMVFQKPDRGSTEKQPRSQ